MVSIWQELITEISGTEVTTTSAIFKLCLSLILGSVVGLERKRKGQIAGVRTFALISMGATLAMLISIYVPQVYLGLKNGDPGRIAAQVITGVGFLGAGAIIQMKGSVKGLTTAAGIWMVATIGMAVGVGMYLLSIIATILILFILVQLEKFEHRIKIGSESRILKVKISGIVNNVNEYKMLFKKRNIHMSNVHIEYDYNENITRFNFAIVAKESTDYPQLLGELKHLNNTLLLSVGV